MPSTLSSNYNSPYIKPFETCRRPMKPFRGALILLCKGVVENLASEGSEFFLGFEGSWGLRAQRSFYGIL